MALAGFRNVLVVVSVEAELAAVQAGLNNHKVQPVAAVARTGVGAPSAAAGTARRLALAEAAGRPFDAVICAGIAGGFPDLAQVGAITVATESIAADLGAESPDGHVPLEVLGFGTSRIESDPVLLAALTTDLPCARSGPILTVSTATGTPERRTGFRSRYPLAVAEAMEGYGVAVAAAEAGVAFGELRTISNPVGSRDRVHWSLPQALRALTAAFAAL